MGSTRPSSEIVARSGRVLGILLFAGALACASGFELDEGDNPRDAQVGDKADFGGIREGTTLALGVLRVANELSQELLRRSIGLTTRVATMLTQRRPVDSLAALDAVPGIGAVSISRMARYAVANGMVAGALPTLPVPSWASGFAEPECSGPELTDAIKFRLLGDRERLVLGRLLYFRKYEGACVREGCGTRYESAPVANLTLVRHVLGGDITRITATVEIEPVAAAETSDSCVTNVPGGRCDARGFEALQRGPTRLRVTRNCVSMVRASTDTGGVQTPVRDFAKGGWSMELPPFQWLGPVGGVNDFVVVPVAQSGGRAQIALTEQRYYNNGEARVLTEVGTQVEPVAGPDKIAADATHVYYTTVNEDECGVWRVAHGDSVPTVVAGWSCYAEQGRRTLPTALALDATDVYYAAVLQSPATTVLGPNRSTTILRVPKAGGAVNVVAYGLYVGTYSRESTTRLALDDTHVYWTEPYAGRVLRAAKSSTGATASTVLARDQLSADGVVVDGARVLFTVNDRWAAVRGVPKSGGAVTSLASTYLLGQPRSLAVDATHLWAAGAGGVLRLARTSPTWEVFARDASASGKALAVVEGYVLWATNGGVSALER